MTSAEKKARELVERMGVDEALKRVGRIRTVAILYEFEEIEQEYKSVREHILKLKNEGK